MVEFMKANASLFNDVAEAQNLAAGQPSQAAEKAGDNFEEEEDAPLVAKRRLGVGRAPGPGRGGRSGRRGRSTGAAVAAGPHQGEADDKPHGSKPTAAPASGAANGDTAASSVASLDAGPAAGEAHLAVLEETWPARKQPAAAESKPGTVPEGAGRSSAAADKGGKHTDKEEEGPLVAKRRLGAGRAPVRCQGGRSGRGGRSKGAAAPVSPDESEPDDELRPSKPARKRPAAAVAAGPDGGEANGEPHRSNPAAAPASGAAVGDAAPSSAASSGARPVAGEAHLAVEEETRPEGGVAQAAEEARRPARPTPRSRISVAAQEAGDHSDKEEEKDEEDEKDEEEEEADQEEE